MLVALAIDGQPREADWPYLGALPLDLSDWTPPVFDRESFTRLGGAVTPDGPEVVALLTKGRPVILMLMLSKSFYVPDDQGVVRPASGEHPDPALRHAVVAVGHGVVEGETSLFVRNSWGETWGQAGHAWLPLSFVIPRLFGMALLDEDKDVPPYSNAA